MKRLFVQFKTAINIIILLMIDYVARKRKIAINKKELIIIRVDVIGDYVLFRNFLEDLRNSPKYQGYKITLLGDKSYRDLAEALDSVYVDKFIWLDKKKFIKNYRYRFTIIRRLSRQGYEVLINPIYSREYLLSETLVKIIPADDKIGCEGDQVNISLGNKAKADKNYTKLLANTKEVLFEFYRNREFFEQLLEKSLTTKYFIHYDQRPLNLFHNQHKYAVLFLGASHPSRQWSPKHFAEVGQYLKKQFNYDIVICGSTLEIAQANSFKKHFMDDCIDLVGKTSLVELLTILSTCQMLVTNETSSAHLAVALGNIPVFVIYNGRHFGRFVPYPKALTTHYYLIAHPFIIKDTEQYKIISNKRDYINTLDINDIQPVEVIAKIAANYKIS